MKRDEHIISLIGFLILMALTLATGISVYAVMLHRTESILSKSFASSLENSAYLIDSQFEQGLAGTKMIATRPFVLDSLKAVESNPEDSKSRINLQRIALSFLTHGFGAISFYDAKDDPIASAGRFSEHPDFNVSLNSDDSLALLWNDQFRLRARMNIEDSNGSKIGTIVTEAELRPLSKAFSNLATIGRTGEFALCAPIGSNPGKMDCFLSGTFGKKFQRVDRVIDDSALPMNYALEGKTGIILAKDYRGQEVVAAYSPLAKLGLGMVLKVDRAELYKPITGQLARIAMLIAFLLILGGLLLYWLMNPLVQQLADSRQKILQSGARLQAILDNAPIGIWLTECDGGLGFMNKTLSDAIGEKMSPAVNDLKFCDSPSHTSQEKLDFADGRSHLLEITRVGLRDQSGKALGVIGISSDITERKKAEEAQLLAAMVFKTVDEAIIVTDPKNDILAVNPAFTVITGYSEEEVVGRNPHVLSSGLHGDDFYRAMRDKLTAQGSWSGEIHNRRKNGEIYVEWLSIHQVRDRDGNLTHHVALFSDISERKMAESQIFHLAHYDILINLPNRSLFSDRLQQAIAQSRRENEQFALMFIDLDKFKEVNDTLGHHAGDMLLAETARRLEQCIRESDTAGRMGGDEFVVLLQNIETGNDAVEVGKKILHALNAPFEFDGQSVTISSSIGIAVYPHHGEDIETLLRHADAVMYQAKTRGGGVIVQEG